MSASTRISRRPASDRHAAWRLPVVFGAFAVVVALAALVTVLVIQRAQLDERTVAIGIQLNDIDQLLADQGAGLPPGLAPAWEPESSPRWPSRHARAVRIGARHLDVQILGVLRVGQTKPAYYGRDSLALAIVARSSARAAALAAENAGDMARMPDGDSAATAYGWAAEAAAKHDFWGFSAWLAGHRMPRTYAPYIVLGGWLEGARVAALRGDRAYFRRPESQAITAAMVQLPRLSRDERAALEQVRVLVMGDALRQDDASVALDETRADLDTLRDALTRAMVLLAD